MDKDKIIKIGVILAIAIVAVVAIIFISGNKKDVVGIEVYKGKAKAAFETQLIKDYKTMKKFIKEFAPENLTKKYDTFNTAETFNEEYFANKKLVAICISEDNGSDFEYHVDKVEYSSDGTMVTVQYTNIRSGYNGSLSSSWNNCLFVEVEGTVTNVNFIEITK